MCMPLDSIMVSPAQFDHEKLDVYELQLKFLQTGRALRSGPIRVAVSASGLATPFEDEHEHEDD